MRWKGAEKFVDCVSQVKLRYAEDNDMRVYADLIGMNLKSQMQYKFSFFLTVIGQFITSFTGFWGISFIFERIEAIEDFTYGQVLLCFAEVMMSFSIGELLGGRLSVFSGMLSDGRFDRALVRPRNLILQIIVPNLDFSRLGILAQAVIVLCFAVPASGVEWNWKKALALGLMVICGVALFFGLFLLQGACAFFTVGNLSFLNIFTYGSKQFGRYPLSIYGDDILRFLTFVIPLALVQYYPLLYLLDRKKSVWYIVLPMVSLLFLIPCWALFRLGIRKYKSTGS